MNRLFAFVASKSNRMVATGALLFSAGVLLGHCLEAPWRDRIEKGAYALVAIERESVLELLALNKTHRAMSRSLYESNPEAYSLVNALIRHSARNAGKRAGPTMDILTGYAYVKSPLTSTFFNEFSESGEHMAASIEADAIREVSQKTGIPISQLVKP